jgi:hypothetical protein
LPLIESEPSVLSVSCSAPRIVAICDIVPPSESDFVPAPLTLPPLVADAVSRSFVSARVIVKVSLDDAPLSVSVTPEIEPPEELMAPPFPPPAWTGGPNSFPLA